MALSGQIPNPQLTWGCIWAVIVGWKLLEKSENNLGVKTREFDK